MKSLQLRMQACPKQDDAAPQRFRLPLWREFEGRQRRAPKLTADARSLAIAQILEARFSLSLFEEMKRKDRRGWNSTRNDMGRGIYGQAIREMQRLQALTDHELNAESGALQP
jgi:hypothetical protein